MAIETLFINLIVGIGVGALAAFLAKFGANTVFDVKKLIYSLAIGAIAGLGVIGGLEGGSVTEANFISVILLILGTSFVGNKSISILQQLTSNVTPKPQQ